MRAEIQQEILKIQQEVQDTRAFAEKNTQKRPAPLRLSLSLPVTEGGAGIPRCTVTEAHRGYHEPTAASVGRSAADRV